MDNFDDPTIISPALTRGVSTAMNEPPLGADNYQIGHEIARGGMGSVLEAADSKLKRTVAVKIMHLDAAADVSARQRFLREAEVLAQLAHPNIVPIYDIVWEDGLPLFYSMKMVKGRTLQAILNALRDHDPKALGDYTLDRLLLIFRKVCDAIAFAHNQGVLHRDLKPENIMVGEFGEVLVMDWGLARRLGDYQTMGQEDEGIQPVSLAECLPLALSLQTLQGSVMGTPQYMSPEQAMGLIDELDERSDIFSLGGILYAILTLRPPVEGSTLEEVLNKVTAAEITSPSELQTGSKTQGKATPKGDVLEAKLIKPLPHVANGRVPAALSAVVMKALRLDKDKRYQTVAALSSDIEAYQGGFATSAEAAGALKQLKLLMLRHKAVTASLAVLMLVSVGFVFKVLASERKATRNAEIATANEQRANENAEQTRRALKTSQLAVAEAAYRAADLPAMTGALDSVSEDLRDQRWEYLSMKGQPACTEVRLGDFTKAAAVKAIPGQAGQFAVANPAGSVGIVDVRSGMVLRRINTPFKGKMVLDVTKDARQLAVTARGATEIKIYRVADGAVEQSVPAPSQAIVRLTFSPEGQRLAVMDAKGENQRESVLFLLDLRDGTVRWQQPGTFFESLFSHDGRFIFSATGMTRAVMVHNSESGEKISQFNEYVACMGMSPDGKRLAIGLFNGEVVLFSVDNGREIRRAQLHLGCVTDLAWTAQDHLITIGNEETGTYGGRPIMRLWDTVRFAERGTFFGVPKMATDRPSDFQPLSGHFFLSGSPSQLAHIPADLESARLSSIQAQQGWSTCFLNDSVLLGRSDFALQSYDVTNPRQPQPLAYRSPRGYVMSAVHWPSGVAAIARRIDRDTKSIKLYQSAGRELAELREIAMQDWTLRMDFDPAGKRLLAIMENDGALVFEVGSGKTLLKQPMKWMRAAFVGTHGEHIAAIVAKKREADEVEDELVLVEAATGKVLKSTTHHQRLDELVVSPDRQMIAVAGAEQVIRVLDAATLEVRSDFRAHDDEISTLAFHPKLRQLASGSPDGSVKLWDYHNARLIRTFLGIDGTPVMLAFSPNGRLLSVESQEKNARLFDLEEPATAEVKERVRPVLKPDAEGWLDLLAAAQADEVEAEGKGWRLEKGQLLSGNIGYAAVPMPLDQVPESYVLRVTVRATQPTREIGVFFPVANRDIGFNFDMWAPNYGSVLTFDAMNSERPDAVRGRMFGDPKNHTFEVTVRVTRPTARIEVQFDGKPYYQWSGPLMEVTRSRFWRHARPGVVSMGANGPHWLVSEVKLKPLD